MLFYPCDIYIYIYIYIYILNNTIFVLPNNNNIIKVLHGKIFCYKFRML